MSKKDIFFTLSLFLFPLAFLSGTLTSNNTFFMRDLTYLFHPWRSLSAQMVQAGEFPLWNSYAMGGMPFLANCQSAILYPFTLFFNFFYFANGLKIFYLLSYGLAGLGTFLLAKKLDWSSWAGWGGAILFSYNGYLLTRLEFLSALGSAIWFPWILLFCNPSKNQPPLYSYVALGFTLALSLLAGFPQILLLQIAGAFLFCFVYGNVVLNIRFLIISGSLFLILSATQWIPTLELIFQSGRGGNGVSFQEAVTYSLPMNSLLGLLYPFRILHHPDRFTGEKFFWIWSAWWGIVTSGILLFSYKMKEKKIFWFASSLGITGILWAMGNQWNFYETFYRHVPFIKWFRYPPVTLYWTVLGITVLVMGTLSSLNHRMKPALLPILLLMTLELWHYSRNLFPTVTSEYYHFTFPGIRSVIKDKSGTVMLSNRLNSQRRLAGMTDTEARFRFRGFFFDLTNLPYRVKSIAFSGEPLALKSYGLLYDRLVTSPSLDVARPWLNLWNVTHFLTYESLDKSWELLNMDSDLKVYKNPAALGESFAFAARDNALLDLKSKNSPTYFKNFNNTMVARYESDKDLKVIFNSPSYPGWKIFSLENKTLQREELSPSILETYFIGCQVKAGDHTLVLTYQPFWWKIALSLSVVTMLIIGVLGVKRAHP